MYCAIRKFYVTLQSIPVIQHRTMNSVLIIILFFALAVATTCAVYPPALKFAIKHKITDKPSARKLQSYPIPVFGGVAIALGMAVPVLVAIGLHWAVPIYMLLFMGIMLGVGVTDDLCNLPVWVRFAIEIAVVTGYIWLGQSSISSFHGLWGIEQLPLYISLPLSIIAGVGIINSINLIDGTDGYSSGFCMMACTTFSILSFCAGDYVFGGLLLICVGAIIPFFVYNVWGKKKKMYIGDGGTLMLGAVMTICVFHVLTCGSPFEILQEQGVGLVAFCLAVLCIPIFDTIRVMCGRICRGVSPFTPDMTHLHHLFLKLGFSHIGTTISIVTTNVLIILCWWLSYRLGASVDVQFYVVIIGGTLSTFGFYSGMNYCIRKKNSLYNIFRRIGELSQWHHTSINN